MQAFSIDEWASVEAYTLSLGTSARPGRPLAAASIPAACRAAASESSDDVEAVSVISPSNSGGRPRAWRIQSITTCSSSVPTGLVRHSIGLEFRTDVSISPMIPGPEAELAK